MDHNKLPSAVQGVLFVESVDISEVPEVVGHDFNQSNNLEDVIRSYYTTGFQATNMAQAIEVLTRMLSWRLSDEEIHPDDSIRDLEERKQVKATVFLAYTSSIVSCGLRENIRYLSQHKLVDVIVTSGGGVEEDFIKCLAPTRIGDFRLGGKELRAKGLNRIGNLLMPNENYVKFEAWIMPIFDQMLLEQQQQGTIWSPSTMISRLGKEINNPESIYYWAYRNNIPVFCPGLTDGSIGDMIYCHSYQNPGLVIDIASDIRRINDIAISSIRSGMFIIGGALPKHHACNANMMKNGSDYTVYLNTGVEYDGGDTGAHPDEAVSWGKIKATTQPVKIYSEATLVMPIIVSQTFVKYHDAHKEECPLCSSKLANL